MAPGLRAGAAMNDEQPVRPLILPETVQHEPVQPLPMPSVPTRRHDAQFLVGVAAVSHSGRVRDQVLFDALEWAPGDRTDWTQVFGPDQLNAFGEVDVDTSRVLKDGTISVLYQQKSSGPDTPSPIRVADFRLG